MKKPDYPPRYIFVLFDMDGYVHEFTLSDKAEAMKAWEDDKAKEGTVYMHAFLYLQQTSGMGYDYPRHLLHSF
jgi:hypothetical protein